MPTSETTITVEQAFNDLRELWPGCSAEIIHHAAAGFYKPHEEWVEVAVISVDYKLHGQRWRADTLDEVMAQVRAWKESQ